MRGSANQFTIPGERLEPIPAMKSRQNEPPKLWFRSQRCYRTNGQWYFHTREGLSVGPYATLQDAEADATLLISQLRGTPIARTVAVVREFILNSGGEFDYVNDPTFSNYLIDDAGEEPA
jgi:hypothetical protein